MPSTAPVVSSETITLATSVSGCATGAVAAFAIARPVSVTGALPAVSLIFPTTAGAPPRVMEPDGWAGAESASEGGVADGPPCHSAPGDQLLHASRAKTS